MSAHQTTTAVVQIGNSDDRLPQWRWAEFVIDTGEVVGLFSERTHFAGAAASVARWQNAAWVFELPVTSTGANALRLALARLAEDYAQASIALTIGETQFVTPGDLT